MREFMQVVAVFQLTDFPLKLVCLLCTVYMLHKFIFVS